MTETDGLLTYHAQDQFKLGDFKPDSFGGVKNLQDCPDGSYARRVKIQTYDINGNTVEIIGTLFVKKVKE